LIAVSPTPPRAACEACEGPSVSRRPPVAGEPVRKSQTSRPAAGRQIGARVPKMQRNRGDEPRGSLCNGSICRGSATASRRGRPRRRQAPSWRTVRDC
jgi:hypothetical protein